MNAVPETLLIVWATPLYVLVIGAEILLSHWQHRNLYSWRGVFQNLYLTLLNGSLDLLLRGLYVGLLVWVYQRRLGQLTNPWAYWTALLLLEDFVFYWLHRFDHFCRVLWAVHVTHHSSEEFNLTTGFRSSVFQPVYRFLYFIPLALLGFRPEDILVMYSATQIWGILVHTQYVGKLGFLEWFLVTPSHHRVHHASNLQYLDRNMGMFLIVWDRLFGTFAEEDPAEPVRYGLTTNITDHSPVNLVFHEWKKLADDLRKPGPLTQKLKYLFAPPGWSHDGSSLTAAQMRQQQALVDSQ
ncbi:sterol desaturase family protein [Rudanella paleaurantiibacter]|uniref:Sterol desaturase family protein n=1 Tax=Rudanella paleaurantiibacter TaxID=2614655 RepID=A0A7J5TTL1_9BACT|nr:sterol desaturase family protein [Rudanella paleaurantiibacter]KAB7727094.1 sterol desaturase family protein [Rudanella paleaurantiibacter]